MILVAAPATGRAKSWCASCEFILTVSGNWTWTSWEIHWGEKVCQLKGWNRDLLYHFSSIPLVWYLSPGGPYGTVLESPMDGIPWVQALDASWVVVPNFPMQLRRPLRAKKNPSSSFGTRSLVVQLSCNGWNIPLGCSEAAILRLQGIRVCSLHEWWGLAAWDVGLLLHAAKFKLPGKWTWEWNYPENGTIQLSQSRHVLIGMEPRYTMPGHPVAASPWDITQRNIQLLDIANMLSMADVSVRWVRLSISKVPVLRKDPSSMWFLDISIGYLFEMALLGTCLRLKIRVPKEPEMVILSE